MARSLPQIPPPPLIWRRSKGPCAGLDFCLCSASSVPTEAAPQAVLTQEDFPAIGSTASGSVPR